ncbi:MAG: carbohydrate ABC transporter permease [Kineosporiaceae bacterium]
MDRAGSSSITPVRPLAAASPRVTGRRSAQRQRRLDVVLLLALPMALLTLASFAPNLLNFGYAFTDWSAFSDEISFVGFDNFERLASDGTLWRDLRTTVVYAATVTLLQQIGGLALALGLEAELRWNRFLRAVLFVPVLLAPLAAGYVWRAMLAYDGVANDLLGTVSGQPVRIEWLGSLDFTVFAVAAVHAWKWVGLTMIIYLAGLATVPRELLDAARVDGANAWQTFWRVKFRLIAPALTVNVALTLIGALNTFDIVLATTGGGPARTTEVLNIYIFQQYGSGQFGQAVAMSLVLFLTVCALAVPLIAGLRRRELTS